MPFFGRLSDNQQFFARPRDGGIQPAAALAAERPGFVENDDEIEFRALRLMAGDGIGELEAADRLFRNRFELMKQREVVFVYDGASVFPRSTPSRARL